MPGVRECPAAPPRAGKFPRGSRRRPGPLAAMRFPGVLFLPLGASPALSSVAAGMWHGPGWRSCPGSASPGRSPRLRGCAPRSITARGSPLPRDAPVPLPGAPSQCPFPVPLPVPCPAPSPPAGVMLGSPRASSGALRCPRVNPPRLGTGGAPRSGHPSRVCIWDLFPPVSNPLGAFCSGGRFGFFH